MASETITLTNKLGTFHFNKGVIISKAKLIRDSITGQFFAPKTDEPRIRTEEDAEMYARTHLSMSLASIPFEVHFWPHWKE